MSAVCSQAAELPVVSPAAAISAFTNHAVTLIDRENAGVALRDFHSDREEVVQAFIQVLADKQDDNNLRRQAAEGLQRAGPSARPALSSLIETVNERNPDINNLRLRIEAAKALASLKRGAKPASTSLVNIVTDEKESLFLRCEAIEALAAIGPPVSEVVAPLVRLLRSPAADRELFRTAVRAIGAMGAWGMPALDSLHDLIVKGPQEDGIFDEAVQASTKIAVGLSLQTSTTLPNSSLYGLWRYERARSSLKSINAELGKYLRGRDDMVDENASRQIEAAVSVLSSVIDSYVVVRYRWHILGVLAYMVLFLPCGVAWRVWRFISPRSFVAFVRYVDSNEKVGGVPIRLCGWLLGLFLVRAVRQPSRTRKAPVGPSRPVCSCDRSGESKQRKTVENKYEIQ
ncbi:MAG: HEAT repeat domain-containing protein [Verrucomicrobiales bacterium]|nr:HEAT repeat domain-containing protein [Verrucomicrobiales bacterium]